MYVLCECKVGPKSRNNFCEFHPLLGFDLYVIVFCHRLPRVPSNTKDHKIIATVPLRTTKAVQMQMVITSQKFKAVIRIKWNPSTYIYNGIDQLLRRQLTHEPRGKAHESWCHLLVIHTGIHKFTSRLLWQATRIWYWHESTPVTTRERTELVAKRSADGSLWMIRQVVQYGGRTIRMNQKNIRISGG